MTDLVDSSGWIEYFTDGPNAAEFAEPLEAGGPLIVPTISIYEVFRVLARELGGDAALPFIANMRSQRVAPLDDRLALEAVRVAAAYGLAMADSIILATARQFDATLWTQDADFEKIDGVRFVRASGR